jgi:hypothetical protein
VKSASAVTAPGGVLGCDGVVWEVLSLVECVKTGAAAAAPDLWGMLVVNCVESGAAAAAPNMNGWTLGSGIVGCVREMESLRSSFSCMHIP